MKKYTKKQNISQNNLNYLCKAINLSVEDLKRIIFFDIETTGLKAETSFLYLIGAIYYEQDSFVFCQFFADSLEDEADTVRHFLDILKEDSILVHFNGSTFDIPYINRKCECFGFEKNLSCYQSIDLYRQITPYKKLFNAKSLRQRAVEELLSVNRKDSYDGGELIEVYKQFLVKTKMRRTEEADSLLSLLLLHNHDDVIGMTDILPILFMCSIESGNFKIANTDTSDSFVTFEMISDLDAPFAIRRELPLFPANASAMSAYLSIEGNHISLSLPLYIGELKLFFKNYKDYYYIPSEDRSLHKSLGTFVDKSLRKAATVSTCYERHEGTFVMTCRGTFDIEFSFAPNDKYVFVPVDFLLDDKNKKNINSLIKFSLHRFVLGV